jgi:hypothetical protein
MKALYFSIILFVGARAAYCDQIVTTLVTETSVDLKSWTPIDTNIVTITGYAEKYRLNIYTKNIDNNFFLKALVGTDEGDGMSTAATSSQTLYYNGNDPATTLPVSMVIYINDSPVMNVVFNGGRIGQSFGFSTTANGPLQYTGVFTNGNVYF